VSHQIQSASKAGGSLKAGLRNGFETLRDFSKWGTISADATKLVATATTDVTKLRLPSSFVSALEKFGKTEGDILTYFTNYHNVRSAQNWLNDIEFYLANKNIYGLTRDETFAVWGYTTNYFYKDLNAWLRGGENISQTQEITSLLNSALNKLPNYSGQFVYRGISINATKIDNFIASYGVGTTKPWGDFTSCGGSLDATFAGRDDVNVIFQIKHTSGKDISDLADGIRYRVPPFAKPEILIKSDSKFEVLNPPRYDDVRKKWVIDMLQIQ